MATEPERVSEEQGTGPALLTYRFFDIDILEGLPFLCMNSGGRNETLKVSDLDIVSSLGEFYLICCPSASYRTKQEKYDKRIGEQEFRSDAVELTVE